MKLKLSKCMPCDLGAQSTWGQRAAAWMGLSFFLRMVFYFGFMILKDVPTGEIVFSVVLALTISVAFILMLKLKRLNLALVAAGLCVAFAVNYFLTEQMNFGGGVSASLVLAMAGMILASVLGYIPERKWLRWTGMAVGAFRLLFVDVFGYILPLSELKPFAYIPFASNACGLIAICYLSGALRLRKE